MKLEGTIKNLPRIIGLDDGMALVSFGLVVAGNRQMSVRVVLPRHRVNRLRRGDPVIVHGVWDGHGRRFCARHITWFCPELRACGVSRST